MVRLGPMVRKPFAKGEPMTDTIRCTVPGCKKDLPPESMWIPEWKALMAANGGRRVPLADLPKFALCGHHGHLLRKEDVRVYRYAETVDRERQQAQRRTAEDLSFRHYASRFKR